MKKFKTIIMTVVLLWLGAYALSFIIGDRVGGEIVSEGIAIVPIHGAIVINDVQNIFGVNAIGSDTILENLKKARTNKGVKVVILEINSGGGAVVASKEVADYVKKLKEEKPVIAWIREVGASGAYWIAASSDVIVADEMSITGSVGVISSYLDYSGLMEKYGVKYERLVAGEFKDTGNPFRELSSEERRMMEAKLRLIQDFFVKDVQKSRNLNINQVNEIKKGFFYLGVEAKDLGLVDVLGNKETAVSKAKELGNISDGSIVEYKAKKSILDLLERFGIQIFFSMGRGIGREIKVEEEFKILA
ncbi:MAG: signal peptide peptidase SppA [Nanoarchaeota archaeon]|nr:signal peptide peptidase SppA [Nanoarchaeota archaeon]|tara:strand:+ start:43145 stop:44056 length:912 start_codon:yes stop_codon:yes gene_type:complete